MLMISGVMKMKKKKKKIQGVLNNILVMILIEVLIFIKKGRLRGMHVILEPDIFG
jgi:hypothetical protein